MAGESDDKGTQSTEQGGASKAGAAGGAPAGQPLSSTPGAARPPADGGQPKQEPGTSQEAPGEKVVSIGDDEYPVDEKGFIQIPATAFKKRLNRYSKSQLKEAFGTDNVDDIKSRLDEHGKLKAESEKERLKRLAKEEALTEELKSERTKREAAEARAASLAEEREFQQADSEVRHAAANHVKLPKLAKLAVYEFGEYVRELDDDDAAKLKPRDVDRWFDAWAKDNADLGSTKKPEEKQGDKAPAARRPMSHGAGDATPPPAPTGPGGAKTPRPGQPNSMTAAEYKAYKASMGIR